MRRGPLIGVRVVELGGLGPVPFAGKVLSNLGAEVVRLTRAGALAPDPALGGGRVLVEAPLVDAGTRARVAALVDHADVVLEGFRPGVAERLGFGPEELLRRQPALVYGRASGWGRTGPLQDEPGHDINFIALSGALGAVRDASGTPVPPPGMIGDFGASGMLLVIGVLGALTWARSSGQGQVVDTSILASSAVLTAHLWGGRAEEGPAGELFRRVPRGEAPFYAVYRCVDGEHLSLGAVEPHFFARLRAALGLDHERWDDQMDISTWGEGRDELARIFATRDRDHWLEVCEGACVAPVLDLDEALAHEQNVAVGTFAQCDGITQPAVAPTFSVTPGELQESVEQSLDEVVARWTVASRDG